MFSMRDEIAKLIGVPISVNDNDEGIVINILPDLEKSIEYRRTSDDYKGRRNFEKIKRLEKDYFVVAKYSISIHDGAPGSRELPDSEEIFAIRFVKRITRQPCY